MPVTDEERFASLLLRPVPGGFHHHPGGGGRAGRRAARAVEVGVDVLLWSNSPGVRDGLLEGGPGMPDSEHPAAALLSPLVTAGEAAGDRPARRRSAPGEGRADVAAVARPRPQLPEGRVDAGDDRLSAERPDVVSAWSTEFELSLPDEAELERIVKSTLRSRNEEKPVQVHLSRRDLDAVLRN